MFSLNYVGVFVLLFIVLIFGHKKATFSKLRVAYNNVYRKVFGLKRRSSAGEMFLLKTISNFEALMRKSIFAFTTRLTNSKNAIICTIQRSWVIRDLIWKVWTDKLYIQV